MREIWSVKKTICRFIIAAMLIPLIGCGGAKNPPLTSGKPGVTLANERTLQPTSVISTPTVAITVAATSTTTSVPKPTITEIPISTPTIVLPTPTWTRLPTFESLAADQRIHQLMDTNGDCVFPCWWGIMPGKTTWQEVYEIYSPFPIEDREFETIPGSNSSRFDVGFTLMVNDQPFILSDFGFQNNIVTALSIRYLIAEAFTPSDLIRMNGVPGGVWISTYNDLTQEGVDPFYMIIFYPEKGVLAIFDNNAKLVGNNVEMCYRKEVIPDIFSKYVEIELWPENEPIGFEEAKTKFSLDTLFPIENIKSLDKATSMDVEAFAKFFGSPGSTKCLKSPRNNWKGNYE